MPFQAPSGAGTGWVMDVCWFDSAIAVLQRLRALARVVLLVLVASGLPALVRAQDMSVVAILQPASGCALGSAESVRIRLRNYGPTLPGGSIFTMAYSINSGAPVESTVFMGNMVVPNGEFMHTFATPADLSAPGIYIIDATITVTGDNNPSNDALVADAVQNWAPSVGGTLPALPGPTQMGTLSLGGHTGTVLEWQQSTDGQRWRALENTTASQSFSGLTEATHFRALVQNGPCAPALSNSVLATTDAIFSNGFEP
jgi:hypothetical protein